LVLVLGRGYAIGPPYDLYKTSYHTTNMVSFFPIMTSNWTRARVAQWVM